MTQTIPAHELTLSEVEEPFNLRDVLNDPAFFSEWKTDLSALTELERQNLDRIRTEFLSLCKYKTLEDLVKRVVISPLLSMAGFYQPPIRPVLEKRVDVALQEGEQTVWGRIDILGL